MVTCGGRRRAPGLDLGPPGPIWVLAGRSLAWLRRRLCGEEEERLGWGAAMPMACLLQRDGGSFPVMEFPAGPVGTRAW